MTIALRFDSVAAGGDAVGRAEDGRVVFVPLAAPGDEAVVELVDQQRRFARGRLLELTVASPQRTPPPCCHFGLCGGCQLQHLDYRWQLAAKRQLVADALARIGKLPGVPVAEVIPTPDPWHYRHTSQFAFGVNEGEAVGGFFAAQSLRIVNVADCAILAAPCQQLFSATRHLVAGGHLSAFEARTGRGALRWLETRVTRAGDQAVATLVTSGQAFDRTAVVAALRASLPVLSGVLQRVVSQQGRGQGRATTLWGDPFLFEAIGGRRLRGHAQAFAQVNGPLVPSLLEVVADYAELTGTETVADLYAGNGFFTVGALAARSRALIAVERSRLACADAQWNFAEHGLTHCRIEMGAVENVVAAWAADGRTVDVVVLDPPRSGAAKALGALAALKPRRVVYVSCDPATLARDLAALAPLGYRVDRVQPLDLFPQTAHVECVARLTRE